MFLVIVDFPPIKASQDEAFKEWFAWSNRELAKQPGFISRRLLKPVTGGNYIAMIEYENYDTFMAMRSSPIHDEAGRWVEPLLDGHPAPHPYEVVIG